MSKTFEELSRKIDQLFKNPNELLSFRIADKIAWSFKWKKITKQESDVLCERMTKYFENS